LINEVARLTFGSPGVVKRLAAKDKAAHHRAGINRKHRGFRISGELKVGMFDAPPWTINPAFDGKSVILDNNSKMYLMESSKTRRCRSRNRTDLG
jgi:hypothetical protein